MYSYKNFIVAFCLLSIMMGCQDITEPKKPKNLISSKKIEEVMYTSALLKAARGVNVGQLSQTGIKPEKYIEDKFGIDSITYAENIAYYTTDVDHFLEMNERVSKRLVKIYSEQDSLNKIDKAIKDSIRKENAKKNDLDSTEIDSIDKPILKYTEEDLDSIKKNVLKASDKIILKNQTSSILKDSLELVKDGLKPLKKIKDSLERE